MSIEANQQDAKITVHWLDRSRGQRIIWLLEELGLKYEIKVYKRGRDLRAPTSLKEIHPLGKSPAITIEKPGEKTLVLAESGSIVEYLCEHFGRQLIPQRYPEGKDGVVCAETEEWTRYRYFMHYAEGSLMPVLFTGLVTLNIRNAPVPFFLKFITRKIADQIDGQFTNPELKTQYTFLQEQLETSPNNGDYLCGSNLTPADIMLSFNLEGGIQHTSLNEKDYPKLYSYVRKLQARDAYIKAGDKVSEASGEKYVPFSEAKM